MSEYNSLEIPSGFFAWDVDDFLGAADCAAE